MSLLRVGVGTRLVGDLATDDIVRQQFLHAGAGPHLLRLAHSSRSTSGRFEARRALVILAQRPDETLARRETELLACVLMEV